MPAKAGISSVGRPDYTASACLPGWSTAQKIGQSALQTVQAQPCDLAKDFESRVQAIKKVERYR
jgi:hypothetical protein